MQINFIQKGNKCFVEKRDLMSRQPPNRIGDPESKITKCFCPLCREFHEINIHWIGRGVPRKYCTKCHKIICAPEQPDIDFFQLFGDVSKNKMPEKEDRNPSNWKSLI